MKYKYGAEEELHKQYPDHTQYIHESVHRFTQSIEPCNELIVPVERQREIIDRIGDSLIENPIKGFLFMGLPNTGKTFLLEQLQMYKKSVAYPPAPITYNTHPPSPFPYTPFTGKTNRDHGHLDVLTLREYLLECNRARLSESHNHGRKEGCRSYFMTPSDIYSWSRCVKDEHSWHRKSLCVSIDECDTRLNETEREIFSELINALYTCKDYVSLNMTMNQTWQEFAESLGLHTARRIVAMCHQVDLHSNLN
jgi:hypothetical protein